MNLINIVKHFNTINKHRFEVFILCSKCGLFWRGLVHDLSKYSPIEFFECAKYYQGNMSAIPKARKEKGYSEAWLHHKGRNKHHEEYWYDENAKDPTPVIPYKYVVEMICDNLAAGKTYNGKAWTQETQYKYWLKKQERVKVNEKVNKMILEVLKQVSKRGVKKVITKKNLQKQYLKYCGKIKKKDNSKKVMI